MIRTALILAGILALMVTAAAKDPEDNPYVADIASAAVRMRDGDYDKAVDDINSALGRRSDDPLAHIALGTLFLHTRQVDRATKEFNTALSMSTDHPLALYGLGLCSLSTGNRAAEATYFKSVATDGRYDAAPALAYVSALSGDYPQDAVTGSDPVVAQITAQGWFKRGQFEEARKALAAISVGWTGFEDESGAIPSFDPASPLLFTARGLAKPYKSPSDADKSSKKVSGFVTLKASLVKAEGISFVVFFVDDSLIGMVNHSPYECQWDTTRVSNGPHLVRIQGNSVSGLVLSDKTVRVMVGNANVKGAAPMTGADVKQAEDALWECLRLKPSRRLAYYTLALCAQAEKDDVAATSNLERVVSIDPTFRDARALLIRHYSPIQKYRAIWKVERKDKVAAITFDDGPNPNTGKILGILDQKGIKATFFVVGTMAEANPEMMRRMASSGHEIENHTYSHRNLGLLPDLEIEKELVRGAFVIRNLTGMSSRFFRSPGGHKNGSLERTAGQYGFSSVFWTVNVSKTEGTTRDAMIRQVKAGTVPGAIILMHNVVDVTLQALPKIIDDLKARGYKLVTISAMLNR